MIVAHYIFLFPLSLRPFRPNSALSWLLFFFKDKYQVTRDIDAFVILNDRINIKISKVSTHSVHLYGSNNHYCIMINPLVWRSRFQAVTEEPYHACMIAVILQLSYCIHGFIVLDLNLTQWPWTSNWCFGYKISITTFTFKSLTFAIANSPNLLTQCYKM